MKIRLTARLIALRVAQSNARTPEERERIQDEIERVQAVLDEM